MNPPGDALHLLALALLAAGLLIVIVSTLAALMVHGALNRLHTVTPITSIGGPLIGLALALVNGWTLQTAGILLVVAILAVTGPVMTMAIGRAEAHRLGLLSHSRDS